MATALKIKTDIMVVAEPNRKITENQGWFADTIRIAAVYFTNRTLKVENIVAKGGFMEVYQKKMTLICCYL